MDLFRVPNVPNQHQHAPGIARSLKVFISIPLRLLFQLGTLQLGLGVLCLHVGAASQLPVLEGPYRCPDLLILWCFVGEGRALPVDGYVLSWRGLVGVQVLLFLNLLLI